MNENNALRPVFVQKADMAVSQLVSGGLLVRDQLKKYILVAIKQAKMMGRVRVTTVQRDSQEIPKMTTFGSQVWHPGTDMEELPYAQRVRPGFDMVMIYTHELVCNLRFPKYFLKAQVEGPAFQSTLIGYLGLHSSRDFDNMILNGDTTSTTDILALEDGMIALAASNTYAAGAASLSRDILDRTMQTMPDEYADQAGLGFFTSRAARAAYRRELGDRVGGLGDQNIISQNVVYDGIPVEWVPLIPTNLGGGLNETVVLHLDPKQFIFAIQENVELETEYHIGSRSWNVVMTCRVGQNYEHEPACVKTTGVLNS